MAKRGGFPGGMPGNMNNIMKQAQKMQKQMEEATKELQEKEGGCRLVQEQRGAHTEASRRSRRSNRFRKP